MFGLGLTLNHKDSENPGRSILEERSPESKVVQEV